MPFYFRSFRRALAAFPFTLALAPCAPAATLLDEVVVTANPLGGTFFEQAQPVNQLTGERLRFRLEPSLGETLSREPGITSTGFAPGASRPVIRGLSDDRVRILQNGAATLDVSNISPDHTVSVDPLSVESIEVVRGPASLLYGPNTIGGVVNVLDSRVPERRIEPGPFGLPLRGRFDGRLGTVDEERSGAGLLEFGLGPVQFHLDGFKRDTQDLRIPGAARSERLRERDPRADEPRDVLPNSFTRTEGGAIGASFVWDRGYLGAAYSGYDSRYGTVAEPDVTIAARQRRWDVRGAVREPWQGLSEVRFRFGLSDYTHTEFEGPAVGTVFDQRGYDGRLEFVHQKVGPLEGAIGVQSQWLDFSATGEEAYLPEVITRVNSVFLFEEAALAERWRLQFGGRYDRQSNAPDRQTSALPDREFDAWSGSAGLVFAPRAEWTVALTASYTQRPPTAVELFANGPHVATGAFEIGDVSLGSEKSFALDLTARRKSGRFTGSASAFYYRFDDFITATPTGEVAAEEGEEGLPIFAYRATRAQFVGGEVEITAHLIEPRAAESADGKGTTPGSPHRLDVTLRGDYVAAQDEETGRSLPRIPPLRAGLEVVYAFAERFTARVEGRWSAHQARTADFELPTDSFFLLDAGLNYRVPVGDVNLDWYVRGANLTDAEARLHTSFLKDIAPLAGRGVVFGLRAEF